MRSVTETLDSLRSAESLLKRLIWLFQKSVSASDPHIDSVVIKNPSEACVLRNMATISLSSFLTSPFLEARV